MACIRDIMLISWSLLYESFLNYITYITFDTIHQIHLPLDYVPHQFALSKFNLTRFKRTGIWAEISDYTGVWNKNGTVPSSNREKKMQPTHWDVQPLPNQEEKSLYRKRSSGVIESERCHMSHCFDVFRCQLKENGLSPREIQGDNFIDARRRLSILQAARFNCFKLASLIDAEYIYLQTDGTCQFRHARI